MSAEQVSSSLVYNPEYSSMTLAWDVVNTLWGGTRAMRAAGATYLPQQPKETRETHAYRLNSSVLYGAFKKTVKELASKPFQRAVTYSATLPSPLHDDIKNVDGRGLNITAFASTIFEDAVKYGKMHFFCDMPVVPEGVRQSIATQRLPYWTPISPCDVIYWSEEIIDGKRTLTEVSWLEETSVRDGNAIKCRKCEITWTREKWTRRYYEESGAAIETGINPLGEIPLVTVNLDKPGEMCALPPLEDLAWMNVAHWQSFSDQRNAIRVARAAFLFGKGFTDKQLDAIGIGPTAIVTNEDVNSDLKMIEVTGSALAAGRAELSDLVDLMNTLGQRPMMRITSNSTATGITTNEMRGYAEILDWIIELARGLTQGVEFKCKWMEVELPKDFAVHVFSDFPLLDPNSDGLTALHEVRKNGDIGRRSYLMQLLARGVFTGDFNVDDAIAEAEDEGVRDAKLIQSTLATSNDPKGTPTGAPQDVGGITDPAVHSDTPGA